MKTLHTIYNNFAKRNLASLRLLFITLLTLTVTTNAWSAEVTFLPSDLTPVTSQDYSHTKENVTIAVSASTVTSEQFRIFKNETITITSTGGAITNIKFTCTANNTTKYGPGCLTVGEGNYSYSENVGTWTGSATEIIFTASTNQVRATEIVVTIAASDPSLTTSTTEIDFSNVAVNSTNTKTFTFSGSNLTANATLAISGTNKSYFSVNTTNVPHSSGSISNKLITVTYEPTAVGAHTATLTISSSGATSKTITLKGNALQEHTVKFFSGGEEVSSKNILSGSTIGTLPSATSCDLTNFPRFVGWTESTIDGTTTTKPTIITTSTTISSNKEYHAVFADKEESIGSGTTGSTTFAPKGSSKSSPWHDNGSIWTFSNITFANDVSAGFPQNGTATVTLPTGAVANTITITRTTNAWSGKISLLVKTGSTTIQTLTQPNTTTTINLTSANQKNTYTFSHNNAATNVAYVDNIKVNYTIPATPTTVTYITSCSTEKVVTLQPNGGIGTAKELETIDGSLILPICTFTREGYRFVGWNTTADGSGTTYQPGDAYTPTENPATLYAKWAKEHTITYNANGGTTTCTDNNKYIAGEQVTVCTSTPTKNGYNFNGWSYAPNVTITSGTFTMPESNVTITAQWTAIEYTITYNDTKGATNSNPGTYTIEDEITFAALTDLPKGYNFTGWNPPSIAEGTTGNQIVTAQWTEKPLTRYRTDCDACIPLDGYAEINGTYHFFPGETITLTVTPPANDVPYTYQWQKKVNSDYENIEGETGLTYTKENATTSDVGHYRCVVSSEGYCDLTPKFDVKCLQLYVYYDNKSDVFNTPLNRGAEENTATISVDLQNANYTYYFKITDGCGNWYGNTGTMVRDNCTNWSMDVNEYCGLQTTKFGTYVFNVNYSDLAHLTVSVIYPAALQEAGKEIYLDNNVLNWTHSNNADGTNKIYYRIGRGDHNNKTAMTLVPGTANLYKVTTSKYDNFDVWHIANNGCHSEFNSIFKTKTNDKWAATQATAFETLPVTLDAVTVTPTTLRSVGGDENNNNCEFYNYDITEGMKTWNAEVIEPTNGTITVSYTHHDGTAVNDFTSGNRDLAHTCLLTITATPNTGYKLGTLTVNDVPFTSGNIHTLTEDAVIKATWTEKATPTFAWSAATCTAALEADNTFPTLNNPNTLPVTYTSSNTDVATIDANGNITLVATGTTTITADGAETATHKSATDNYTLKVVKRHTIKWIVNGDTDTPYETTYVVDGDALVLPSNPDAPSTCEEKVFIGWTESTTVNADGSDIEYVDENTKPNTDKTYYAVFASLDGDAAGNYKKVTSELSDWSGEYLIVYETSETTGVAFDGSGSTDDQIDKTNNNVSVTINNNTIQATDDLNNRTFIIEKMFPNDCSDFDYYDYYSIRTKGGTYIGRESDSSNGLDIYNTPYPHQIYWIEVENLTNGKEETIIYSVINCDPSEAILLFNVREDEKRFRYFNSYQEPIALYRKSSYTDYTTVCVETYNVIYDANGATSGNVPVDENNYILDATVTVLGNTGNLQKTHCSFVEWNTQADGNGTSYQAGETFTITEDVTLYAIWEELPQYSVVWYVNGKQLTDIELNGASTTVYEGDRITKTPPAPNPEDFCGQVFVGWTDAEMDVNDTNKPTIYNLVDEFPTASGNQTFYAVFADYVNE